MDALPDINPAYVIYGFAALAAALAVEAAYLLFARGRSYRDRVNRRLVALKANSDREQVLVQLRRERGLSGRGDFMLPIASLNRLILHSGLKVDLKKLILMLALLLGGSFVLLNMFLADPVRAGALSLAVGLVAPFLVLRSMRAKRQKAFGLQFPDAIDVIVRSLRAGHPVPVAIGMVAREMPDPVGTEFGMVADEITYGADLETAIRGLFFRVGQEDLPLFVTAVAIQGSTGGNLSEILSNLSRVTRERFKMRRKIRALSAEGRMSAIILSSLPVLVFGVLYFLSPDYYSADVWADPVTKPVFFGAVGWMMFGNLIMNKMVNFRI